MDKLHCLEQESPFSQSKAQICINQKDRLSNLIFEKIYILVVYNKVFICVDQTITLDFASVTLKYQDQGKSHGFPLKFKIQLTYKLNKTGHNLSIQVINLNKKDFPITLGWRPNFSSVDLENNLISFNSSRKYLFNNQKFIARIAKLDVGKSSQLKGIKVDDSYPLEIYEVEFSTPEYGFTIGSMSKEYFLPRYTPDHPDIIVIEPMNSAADNLKNNISILIRHPNDTYNVA